MLKTYLITLHNIGNPGSSLQAYALNKYLNDLGIDNTIIDYKPYYTKIDAQVIRSLLRILVFWKNHRMTLKKYEAFAQRYMQLTSRCYRKYSDLKRANLKANCFIVGSDQLWNATYKCGRDKAFKLAFVKDVPKISYATSVGRAEIPEKERLHLIRGICDFEWISVREQSTSSMLSRYMKRRVEWVCDPVFLLDKSVYEEMIKGCDCTKYDEYAVMYLAESSPLLDGLIDYLRVVKGWKIIQAGGNRKRCNCDVLINCVDPVDFLALIKNAKFVISGSFHATAFSLIFEKQFGVLLPNKNEERIISLLNLVGLENKIIMNNSDFEYVLSVVDYMQCKHKLKQFIEESGRQFNKALLEIKVI